MIVRAVTSAVNRTALPSYRLPSALRGTTTQLRGFVNGNGSGMRNRSRAVARESVATLDRPQ